MPNWAPFREYIDKRSRDLRTRPRTTRIKSKLKRRSLWRSPSSMRKNRQSWRRNSMNGITRDKMKRQIRTTIYRSCRRQRMIWMKKLRIWLPTLSLRNLCKLKNSAKKRRKREPERRGEKRKRNWKRLSRRFKSIITNLRPVVAHSRRRKRKRRRRRNEVMLMRHKEKSLRVRILIWFIFVWVFM